MKQRIPSLNDFINESVNESELPLDTYKKVFRNAPTDLFGVIFKLYEDWYGGNSGITDDIAKFFDKNKITKKKVVAVSDSVDNTDNYNMALSILMKKGKKIDSMKDSWDGIVIVTYYEIGKDKFVHLEIPKRKKGVIIEI